MNVGDPGSVSHHTEQQYIWFKDGVLYGYWDVKPYMNLEEWGKHSGGTPDQCHWMCLIIRNKNIYGLGLGIWTVSRILGFSWSEEGGHAPGGPFETLLHNFISISIISPNFRTIHPVVTEISSGQNLGGFRHAPLDSLSLPFWILKPSCKTSYPYLSYPQNSEQSVQWLLRTRVDKIMVERKKKKKNKKQIKNNKSPHYA